MGALSTNAMSISTQRERTMANNNETVNEIRAEVGEYLTSIGPSELPSETQVEEFADRFASAHEREMNAIAAQKAAEAHEANDKNAELAEAIAAKDAEIVKLRSLIEGLLEASSTECADCRYDCGPNRENCIIHEAANYIKEVEVEND